ncbi:MAG: ABC transporter permease subunit [Lentihominibacter sp.]
MKAIYKKELASYFRSMTGYVLIAFLIMFAGIYFMVYNMYQGYPYFSYSLSAVMTILLVWVPVLTMRSFAEERKGKTDQLLLTAPVRIRSIVLGKYFAMVTVFLIPVLIFCLFPLLIKASGTAYLAADYAAILQFLLTGCVFIAIGIFFSSLTESPVIAAVSNFTVILIIYLWSNLLDYIPDSAAGNLAIMIILCCGICIWLYHLMHNRFLSICIAAASVITNIVLFIADSSRYEGFFAEFLGKFDLLGGFNDAAFNRIFNVPGAILQLTVIGVSIFLTIQSIEKRRWS